MNKGETLRNIGIFLTIAGLLIIGFAVSKGLNADIEPFNRVKGVSVAGMGGDFTLTGHSGARISLSDFKGKIVLIFFGYTYCPDICPTELIDLDDVLKELGDSADRIQVLFITVDPERDTPDRLESYVTHFNETFIGLTGTPEEIRKVTGLYGALYAKGPVDEEGDYAVGHQPTTYVVNHKGDLVDMISMTTPVDIMTKIISGFVDKIEASGRS